MIAQAFGRLFVWTIRRIGFRTLVSLALLTILLESAVIGLSDVIRDVQDSSLGWAALFGLILGWMAARSRLRGWQALALLSAAGFIFILYSTLPLAARLLALARAGRDLLGPIIYWQWGQPLPGASLFFSLANDFGWTIWQNLAQGADWAGALLAGRAGRNPVAASLVWGFLTWGAAAWAAWAIRRRQQPLQAALPAGLLLISSFSFARASVMLLAPFLASLIILLGWNNLLRQEQTWEQQGLDYAEDLHMDTGMLLAGIATLIATGAMIVSLFSPQKALQFLQQLGEERSAETSEFGEALGLESAPGEPARIDPGSLPRQHLLGAGPELNQQLVMIVRTDRPLVPTPGLQAGQTLPPLYWRSLTYDVYSGSGWRTSPVSFLEYSAGQMIHSERPANQQFLLQTIQPLGHLGQDLYYAGSFSGSSLDTRMLVRDVQLDQAQRMASLDLADTQDLFGVSAEDGAPEDPYTVRSLLPGLGKAQLRAADGSYPAWIQTRYLALPASVPERVKELSATITAGAMTPYDKAAAIESYLRTFPYTLDIAAPPEGRDVADYFLFELKQGYCDYFATAMVVLARAAGLPARLVMGYASGVYDPESGQYLVSEADAHTWAEVYFPGAGWIEFEPTSSRPAIQRPEDLPPQKLPEIAVSAPLTPQRIPFDWRWLKWPALVAGLVGLAALLTVLMDNLWLRTLSPQGAARKLYRRLRRHAKAIQAGGARSETPNEFSLSLGTRLDDLSRASLLLQGVKPAADEVRTLVDLYARATYSPNPLEPEDQAQAAKTWQRLRWRLWLAHLSAYLHPRVSR